MVTILAFVVLGGGAYAANQLPKNSVGSPQIKSNAVTKAKIKKNSVTTAKIRGNAVTGAKVNEATLATVPTAQTAATASTASLANTASTASTANSANIANSLSPSEGWHEVGVPGEPGFQNGWSDAAKPFNETAAFYKDHEGIVHLKGEVSGGSLSIIFRLPPGYRPAAGKNLFVPVACEGAECPNLVGSGLIYGGGIGMGLDGLVSLPGETISLNGITFRAES